MAPGDHKPAPAGGGGAFVFVNTTSDSSATDHKASRSARAFVMRNARAARPWTTRSKASQAEDANGAGLAHDEQDHAQGEHKALSSTGDGPSNLRKSSATGKGRQGSASSDKSQTKKRRPQHQSPKRSKSDSADICSYCGHELKRNGSASGKMECLTCSQSLAVVSAQTILTGEVDPLRTSAVRLDGPTSYLLEFCGCPFEPPSRPLYCPS